MMELSTTYCRQVVFGLESSPKMSKTSLQLHRSYNVTSVQPIPGYYPSKQHQTKYVQNVAGDLHFSKEVVKDRGLSSLPYIEWDSQGIYNISDIIPPTKGKGGSRIKPKRHKICHLNPTVPSRDIKSKSCPMLGNSIWKKPQENVPNFLVEQPKASDVTGLAKIMVREKAKPSLASESEKPKFKSEEVLLKMLTKATAQWLLAHGTEHKADKERFCQQYGLNKATVLIGEEHLTEEDFRTCNELEKSNIQKEQVVIVEKKAETLLPVYYNITGYLPSPTEEKKAGGKSKTAETLVVKHYELPPPLRLHDTIYPKAGKHVYITENEFEKELYPGASKTVHQKDAKQRDFILMDNHNKYMPTSYHEWGFADEKPKPKKMQQGPWNEWQVLHNILSQWKSAWVISSMWKDATLEQLTRDLASVHKVCKTSALVTIASSAVAGPLDGKDPREIAIKKIDGSKRLQAVPALPSEIQNLITDALHNEDDLVRMAAALSQFFIQEFSEEARRIMFTILENGNDADSWAAAQCLALEGNHTYLVIQRILTQLFEQLDEETEDQALYLLSLLSQKTTLVHSLLGEALNRSNWKDRIVACRTLSHLHGDIRKDLKNKLNHLMWNDWSPAVRWAAAKVLGSLGQGKKVHDQIRKHLEGDSWKSKVEALSLIGQLQIMTAQLFSGFLQCFTNDFAAVRRQACRTAGVLHIKDEMVMKHLYHILQNDPVWKIQAQAIRTLGQIGHITAQVKGLLLWAMKLEEPEVRMEVYNCIAKLQLCDSEVQYALQDRLTLESHGLANRELRKTLDALNMKQSENQEMLSMIKQQMSKMCQKEVLFPKILKLNEDLEAGHQKMELLLRKTPNWRNRIQEPLFFCNLVDKAFSGTVF
ncbi:PREDICTED: HEAT repeat-containing protein 4 [Nanorana parkeri]|uniref:HEAT repeat-containing protein 4 n=1 Tax=Nanorana parkeri TaxID=125878 RepID=UPI00085408BD|nr:PREDICTED: HEAT repeat-containing protein 4 [Nanorana parkeri]